MLAAALGLLLFCLYVTLIHQLGWLRFRLLPVAGVLSGLAALNIGLASTATRWAKSPWSAWLYEGFHAAVLTVVLHLFGGLTMGVFLLVYGFLVVHTEVLRPDSSVFVTANICGLCYAALGLSEQLGWTEPHRVLDLTLLPGERLVFVTFAVLSLNFLALYASRHGSQLRLLAEGLERMVTERTAGLCRANEELTRIAVALREKQEELQTFVYTVTHDLKGPLSGIVLRSDMILEREGPGLSLAARADIERVMRSAEHTEGMIRDLLALFQITTSPEVPAWVSLEAVARRTLEVLGPRITAKNTRVEIGVMPVIWGQEQKLFHVFANLLDNAIKYVPGIGGHVAVEALTENGDVTLCIRDNGIGIAPAYQTRIFETFGRVPVAEQLVDGKAVVGSGVGLAIVKQIVEAQGGRVWVESRAGSGSGFFAQIPREPRP